VKEKWCVLTPNAISFTRALDRSPSENGESRECSALCDVVSAFVKKDWENELCIDLTKLSFLL